MSIFEHMTWGLGTPNLPKLGARAILQRGYVDFLGDRAGMYGEPDEAWRGVPSATRCCRTSCVS